MKDIKDHLENALSLFMQDPADSDFQRGYLSALIQVYEDLGFHHPLLEELKKQVKNPL